jgi:hypothetical protein
MIIMQHSDECAGAPVAGKLTGKCDCATFRLTEAARERVAGLIASLEGDSVQESEDPLYFAVRLDLLAAVFEKRAHSLRMLSTRAARKAKR